MELMYNPKYPGIDDLRNRAQKKMPRFAFEYLDGGCNEDVNLNRNRSDVQAVELMPQYISEHAECDLGTNLFELNF